MSGENSLVDALLDLGKAILPLAMPGSGPAIAAAEKAIVAINTARETIGATSAELDAVRDELVSRVNGHVNATVDTLRGDA